MSEQNGAQQSFDALGAGDASAPLKSRGLSLNPVPEIGLGDGRIPAELREWVLEQFPDEELLHSLDMINEQECLELSEFLDLSQLERMVASEQAQRQR